MVNYVAVVHKDEDSDYSVSFPDFLGCITAGSTLDEAVRMAHEALQFHIEGMQEDNDTIPAPSTMDEAFAASQDEFRDTVHSYFMVSVTLKKEPARFNASFDPDLLAAVDRYAKSHSMTRSGFLAEAARHELGLR